MQRQQLQQPGVGGQPWWLEVRPTHGESGDQVAIRVLGAPPMVSAASGKAFVAEPSPLPGVQVRATGPDGFTLELVTDASGRCGFTATSHGDWKVVTVEAPTLAAVLPVRPADAPGTGLWLIPALLLGCFAGWRALRPFR